MYKSILNLQEPIIALSPMDGVSDASFRFITKKYGNPDIVFTEFVNVMGLCIAGYNTLKELYYDEIERPIIGQIYGKDPEYFYHAAKIICALGFDGVDINMGCPAKNVSNSGSGAALIRTPDLAREIVAAVKQGVQDWVEDGKLTGLNEKTLAAVKKQLSEYKERINTAPDEKYLNNEALKGFKNLKSNYSDQEPRYKIPVSVKTRIGYDHPVTEEWIRNLDKADPAWISVHGRTLKQMYTGIADRTELKKAVESTDKAVLINGDLDTKTIALQAIEETGAFGALIGRGSFGNPWTFLNPFPDISLEQKKKVMIEHTKKFIELNSEPKAFFQMRKHFGWYMKGFDGAKELRIKLLHTNNLEEVKNILI